MCRWLRRPRSNAKIQQLLWTAMKPRASRQRVLCQLVAIITRDVRHRRDSPRGTMPMCLFRRSGPAGWKAHYGNEESSLPGITSVPTIFCYAFPALCLVPLRLRASEGGEVGYRPGCFVRWCGCCSPRPQFNGIISPKFTIFIKPRLFGSGLYVWVRRQA